MENGGREQEQRAESDEEADDDHQQNTSDPGRDWTHLSANLWNVQVNELSGVGFLGQGWTANFRDSREAVGSQSLAEWDATESSAQKQESSWANFTQFQPFSGWDEQLLLTEIFGILYFSIKELLIKWLRNITAVFLCKYTCLQKMSLGFKECRSLNLSR